jgi:hypothetical protein
MTFPQKTAAVSGTGFIGAVHVEALQRLGIRVKGILGSSPGKAKCSPRIGFGESILHALGRADARTLWTGTLNL